MTALSASKVRTFNRRPDDIERQIHPEPTILFKFERQIARLASDGVELPSQFTERQMRVITAAWRRFGEEILGTIERKPVVGAGLLSGLKTVRNIFVKAGEEVLEDGSFKNLELEKRIVRLAALVLHEPN